MSTRILDLKIWNSYKYIEGGRTVPPINSRKLPTADLEFHDLRVRSAYEIDIPVHRFKVDNASYLWARLDIGTAEAPEIVEKFGWIEGAEMIAASGDVCRLRWHEDLWRCGGSVTDAKGWIVKKASGNRPYPFVPSRWEYQKSEAIMGGRPKWIMISYSHDNNSDVAFWDSSVDETIGTTGKYAPSLSAVVSGSFLSGLGIPGSAVSGVWMLPFQPYEKDNLSVVQGTSYAAYRRSLRAPKITTAPLRGYYQTTDDAITVVLDPYGGVAGSCPWGSGEIVKTMYHVNIGASFGYIRLYLLRANEDENTQNLEEKCIIEGRALDIPMIPVTYWSNAQSEYEYSGQKEYDRKMAELNAKASLGSAGTGIVGGAITGTMIAPGPGTAIGAAVGAVGDIAGIGINYWKGQEELKAKQELISQQAANVLGAGEGDGWYAGMGFLGQGGRSYRIVQKTVPVIDKGRLFADKEANGHDTFESFNVGAAFYMLTTSTYGYRRTVNAEVIIDKGKTYSDFISSKMNQGFIIEEKYPLENDVYSGDE